MAAILPLLPPPCAYRVPRRSIDIPRDGHCDAVSGGLSAGLQRPVAVGTVPDRLYADGAARRQLDDV